MSMEMQLSPEPTRGVVLVEQLRTVGLGLRKEAVVFSLLLAGLGTLLLRMLSRPGVLGNFDFQPGAVVNFMVLAAVTPIFVWRAESPERRTYLWSTPVSRRSGQVLKLASGWLWTMLGVGGIVAWGWAMALITDGLIWAREHRIEMADLTADAAFEVVGGIALYQYQLPAWLMLVPFALATILYLGSSVVVLSTNHPQRWAAILLGVVLGVYMLDQAGEAAERRVLTASLGRTPLYSEIADEDRFLERLLGREAPYGLTNLVDPEPSVSEVIPGTNKPLSVRRANLSNWLSATAIWGGLALLAASIAAFWHRDP